MRYLLRAERLPVAAVGLLGAGALCSRFALPDDFVAALIRGALSLCGGGRVGSEFLSLYYSFHPHQWHARDGGPTRAVAVAVAVILVQNGHPEENGRGKP